MLRVIKLMLILVVILPLQVHSQTQGQERIEQRRQQRRQPRAGGTFTTNVTATITDSDNQTWNNGTWSASLYNPSSTQQPVYTQTGQPVQTLIQNQTLSSTGVLSYAIPDNNQISPTGTRWSFTLCSNTSAPCSSASSNILITGTTQDISSILSSQITAPRFNATGSTSRGYLDIEATNPVTGNAYFNVTTLKNRQYNGTAWVDLSGGGAGTPAGNPMEVQINNGAGSIGAASNVTYNNSGGLNVSAAATSGVPTYDIRNASFAGGAKCNGTNDDTSSLQAALNALQTNGGNILIPSGSTATTECYIAHNETLQYPSSSGPITLLMSGTTLFGTTFTIPYGAFVNVIGQTGGQPTQWYGGPIASITVKTPSAGTLGSLNTGSTSVSSFAVTTGSISAGSNSLTVSDPTSYNNGDWIVLANAATGQYPLFAHITSIAGNVFTLDTNAQVAMTNVSGNLVGRVVTFTPSSMTALVAGTSYYNVSGVIGGYGAGITVTDKLTCNITSMTRTAYNGLGYVNAQVTPQCHIPVGAMITVAGASDSSFNGTPAIPSNHSLWRVISNDYANGVMSWVQNTATNSSATGGNVTGLNEDTVEDVSLIQNTSTTATAVFWRGHASTTIFGLDTMNVNSNNKAIHLRDIIASTYNGTALFFNSYHGKLQNVGAFASACQFGQQSNFPVTIMSPFTHIEGGSFIGDCQPWGVHTYNPYNAPNGISGPIYMHDSVLMGGLKADHGAAPLIDLKNVVLDQVTAGGVMIDPTNNWSSSTSNVGIENSGYNDNPAGFTNCFVYYNQVGAGTVSIRNPTSQGCITNEYFYGRLRNEGPGSFSVDPTNNQPRGLNGTYNDGNMFIGELRSLQSNLAPSVIPHATLNVTTSPASWTPSGGTTISTVDAPDGTSTAGRLTATANGGVMVLTQNIASPGPANGDIILYGGWIRSTTPGAKAAGGGQGASFYLDNYGSTHFYLTYIGNTTGAVYVESNAYDAYISDDAWHPIVAVAQVVQADGTSGYIRLQLPSDTKHTTDYWQPFCIYIRASEGIPLREILRWRSDLLHGYVPANATAGLVAMNPNSKLSVGNAMSFVNGNNTLTLQTPTLSSNYTINFPSSGGTLALASASTAIDYYTSVTGCVLAASTDSQCQGTINITSASMPDVNYQVFLTVQNNNTVSGQHASITANVDGTTSLTTTSIPYTLSCTFFCSGISTPTLYVHAHHN